MCEREEEDEMVAVIHGGGAQSTAGNGDMAGWAPLEGRRERRRRRREKKREEKERNNNKERKRWMVIGWAWLGRRRGLACAKAWVKRGERVGEGKVRVCVC